MSMENGAPQTASESMPRLELVQGIEVPGRAFNDAIVQHAHLRAGQRVNAEPAVSTDYHNPAADWVTS